MARGYARAGPYGEVLLARFTAELAAIPRPWWWGRSRPASPGIFTAELTQAGKDARHAHDGQRYLHLRDDLDLLIAEPPLTPLAERKAGKVLAKPVRRGGAAAAACPGGCARRRGPGRGDP